MVESSMLVKETGQAGDVATLIPQSGLKVWVKNKPDICLLFQVVRTRRHV